MKTYTMTNRDDREWTQTWTEEDILQFASDYLTGIVLASGSTANLEATRIDGNLIYLRFMPGESWSEIKNVPTGEYPCHIKIIFPDFEIEEDKAC